MSASQGKARRSFALIERKQRARAAAKVLLDDALGSDEYAIDFDAKVSVSPKVRDPSETHAWVQVWVHVQTTKPAGEP